MAKSGSRSAQSGPKRRSSVATVAPAGAVEQLPIDLLRPYPNNARRHSEAQIARLASSLEKFGWTNPVLADREGTIIAGHGRVMAARELGLSHVPVIRIERMTPDDVRAYRLADNRLAELAGWDDEMLAIELQHLSTIDLDFSIEVLGWDHAEIDVLLDPPVAGPEGMAASDPADQDVPGPSDYPVTRPGDLWRLGGHRLLCGSALEPDAYARLMAGEVATMVVTDHPYNVPISGHVSGLGRTRHREFAMASGEMSEEQFQLFLRDSIVAMAAHVVDGGILAMCMDWRGLLPLQLALREAGLGLINLAVWAKTNGGMGALYRSQHEMVLIAKKGRSPHINNVELGRHKRYRTNVWRYPGVNSFGRGRMEQLGAHPTVKPIPLVADVIRDVSHRGDIVLDPFVGSGTTLLAAERTGRAARGIDIDPAYVDVTIGRWQKLTGGEAVLVETGETFAEVAAKRSNSRGLPSSQEESK